MREERGIEIDQGAFTNTFPLIRSGETIKAGEDEIKGPDREIGKLVGKTCGDHHKQRKGEIEKTQKGEWGWKNEWKRY